MIEFDQPQSMLHFYQQALGTKYLIWLPLTAIIGFVLTLLAVVKWRGSVSVALLILAVPMPIVAGLYGYFDGMLASFQIIAMSTTQPKPSEWAQGEAMALVSVLVGCWLSVPLFVIAVIGSFIHWIRGENPTRH
ncbi:MAG TPA: hypothetical protein VHV77_09035 [Pirellulales bacterium]|nr:hypothetical protein [Pirellulales bacterium]